MNSWDFIGEPVAHLDELLERCGFGRATDDDDGDRMLWHLVHRAADDELAARIVIHRVLPALMSIAKRRGRIHPKGPYGAMADLLATAWIVVRTYPCDRRPRKVAANIVRDSEYHAFVRDARLKRVHEVPVNEYGPAMRSAEPEVEPLVELTETLLDARRSGVPDDDIALLCRLASGESSAEVAESMEVSARTVRNRRRRAIDAVRDAIRDDE